MRESVTQNAIIMRENALALTGGDTDEALWLMCEAAAHYWQLKGAGIDREGIGYQSPKPRPEPILTSRGA